MLIERSSVALWYALSIAVTVTANFNEVIAAALGAKALMGIFNSVTAALISSLMAALAIAEQIHQDRIAKRRAQEELRKTYDAMPIGLFTLSPDGHLMRANPAMETIIGKHQWSGASWASLFGIKAWESLLYSLEAQAESETEIVVGNNGNEHYYLVKATRANSQIEGSLQDITQRTLANTQLQFLAEHDPLTGILNRRGLEAAFNKLSGRPAALAYIDLDRFKLINDLYGHTAGDEILKQICQQFSTMLLPESHHLGRVGGDEFVIIFDTDDIYAAELRCKNIVEKVFSGLFHTDEKALLVNASIGLIEVPPGRLLTDAISAADRACRNAKNSGANHVTVYLKDATVFAERAEELRFLKQISQNELPKGLLLYAQPIMSTRAPFNSMNFEFLLRMQNSDSSHVESAFNIIKAAETSGRISVIDRWVFLHALDWIETNHDKLARTHAANLNMSGASLNDARFVEDVFAMLADHPNAAKKVCLEITESVALNDIGHTQRFIEEANSHGSRIALDDFGAGYTSFSYLRQLPADAVKIDGQFVVGATSHPANMAIVSAISDLSRNLGMQSIAEWVEDITTLRAMTDIGIDHIQGFIIARPQPLDQILTASSAAAFIQDQEVAAYVKSIQSLDLWSTQDFNQKGLH